MWHGDQEIIESITASSFENLSIHIGFYARVWVEIIPHGISNYANSSVLHFLSRMRRPISLENLPFFFKSAEILKIYESNMFYYLIF